MFGGSPETVYLGGGTPSRLPVAAIRALVELAPHATEVTVEVNPEDLTPEWLHGVCNAGVTRLSLGVQSLQRREQRVLGRGHQDAHQALSMLRDVPLSSWSADLMFGLPGQTLDALDADLDALLAYAPPHVSLYDLTLEPDTGLTRLHQRRPLALPDEDLWAAMQDRIIDRLADAGLERYEISNFARPGHRSVHNSLYWSGAPYLGAGPGAHGFAPDGRRWVNPPWGTWSAGEPPSVETPSLEQRILDRLVSGMRGIDGLDRSALLPGQLDDTIVGQLMATGLLAPHPKRLQLTRRGQDVVDAVTRTLADALTWPSG